VHDPDRLLPPFRLRRDGKGNFVELINQALDLVEAGTRLDEIATPKQPG
jgi:hypothetical protein